jgi:hypothetical protein
VTVPPAEPTPLILTNASLMIDDAELACVASHVELSPDVSVTTLDTFCGSKDYPGVIKWSLVATLYQSFDPTFTEEVLDGVWTAYKADGSPASFRVCGYRDQPVSATNPEWTGEAIPQPWSPINGDAGDASTVDIEWSIVGEPVKNIVPVP